MERFNEFCDSVLQNMPRATRREKDDIREELQDHLEEHREVLIGFGLDKTEAEKRAVAAMGDAETIGRAWNEKLSPFWLWLGRVCMVVCVLIVLFNVSRVTYQIERVWNSATIRNEQEIDVGTNDIPGFELFWESDPGIVEEFGQHVIRIHKAALWRSKGSEEEYRLQIYAITYAQNPFDYPINLMNLFMTMDAEGVKPKSGGGTSDVREGYTESHHTYQVEKGQGRVAFHMEYNGNRFDAELELDWGGVNG